MPSKTKIGSILVGLSFVIATIGGMLQGQVEIGIGITTLITEIGVVITALGLRDLPIFDRPE